MNLQDLFKTTLQKKASDLHLTVGLVPYLRIDGELKPLSEIGPLSNKEVQRLVFGLLSEEQKAKFAKDKDLDFAYELPGEARFRVNVHLEKGNYGLVARLIPEKIPTMEEIDMPKVVYEMARLKQGLIIFTGPTGCGKSTSLAAIIDLINKERKAHIITLEDPIEFVFKPDKCIIKQRELGDDMLSFQEGLRHALRQDPNVVMVGEMRDLETIAAAITLAETGHLILATLHTYNAAQAVDRIIDIFPPYQQTQIRSQLSMTLVGVVSQRLLPKKGGGRVAAREILINTPAVANLIRESKVSQIKSSIQTSAREGMVSMKNALEDLVKKGQVEKKDIEPYLDL